MLMLMGLGLGCTPAPTFESPWEDARPTGEQVSGWARAAVDSPQPGAGWFRVGDLEAHDFSWATVREVDGASAPVVVVMLGGVESDGTNVLEFDIALPAFVAGPLTIDGQAGIGQLRTLDGREPFVIDGAIEVRAAGTQPGEWIELAFTDLVLGEEP